MTVRRFPLQSTASNDEKRLHSDDLPQRSRRNVGAGIGAPSVKSLDVNRPWRRRDGPAQTVVPQVHPFHLGQVSQRRGNRAAQLVAVQTQLFQVAQVSQRRGNRAGQLVVVQKQLFQIGQVAQRRGNRAAESDSPDTVFLQVQLLQECQVPQPGGDCLGEAVVVQIQAAQVNQPLQIRDGAGQLVVVQKQIL